LSWIIARRRRPAAGYAALLLGLVVVAALYAAITASGGAQASSNQSGSGIAEGQEIFAQNCASCHGLQAQGQAGIAPSLIGLYTESGEKVDAWKFNNLKVTTVK